MVRHPVFFYGSDGELADAVCDHVAPAMREGAAALLIATPSHLAAIVAALVRADIDIAGARAAWKFIPLDAAETLARFMVEGRPNEHLFNAAVGGLVRALHGAGHPTVAYGEMVALLWNEGNVAAALELEELWSKLLLREDLSLLCGYDGAAMAGPGDAARAVTERHSEVRGGYGNVPTDEWSRLFPCDESSPREARRFVAAVLEEWGMRSLTDAATLIVTELASNALRHAGTDFVVTISRREGVVRIAVKDGAEEAPQVVPAPSARSSGHGVAVVSALSERWGVDRLEPFGKSVWADLAGRQERILA